MKGTTLFAVSLAIFALVLGFFLGNFGGKCDCCCNKAETAQCMRHGMQPPPPPGPQHHQGEFHGPHGDFGKGPGPRFRNTMNPAAIDSLLQVTPEQKESLDANRAKGDSIFKELRKQKHSAEKALGEALDSRDPAKIEAAKALVLEADKALLEHRINGVNTLAKVLTPEQFEKFSQFRRDHIKKMREQMKDFRHGPKGPQKADSAEQ